MAHDERAHPSDDPARSVERAEEREEDFDDFLSKLESLPSTDLTSDDWTMDLAEGREETPTFEPIAESSAKDLARAPDETRNVKRQRRAPPPPRARAAAGTREKFPNRHARAQRDLRRPGARDARNVSNAGYIHRRRAPHRDGDFVTRRAASARAAAETFPPPPRLLARPEPKRARVAPRERTQNIDTSSNF